MDELMKAITEIGKQIKETDTKLSAKIDVLDGKFLNFQTQIEELKVKQKKQDERLDYLEKEIRIRNLVLFGVPEQEESYSDLEKLILKILFDDLQIKCHSNEIQHARRIGKKGVNPRPINVGLTTYSRKVAIMQNKHKLDKTGFYIKEDFPPKVLQERKNLQEQLKKETEKGNKAFIKYNKLIVRESNTTQNDKTNETNTKKRARTQMDTELSPSASSKDSTRVTKKNKIYTGNKNITQYLALQTKEPIFTKTKDNLNDQ